MGIKNPEWNKSAVEVVFLLPRLEVSIMAKKDCNHRFVATAEKGEWRVSVNSTNNRGTPDDEFVRTTVFKCQDCGSLTEYPDEWESNYVAPVHAGKIYPPSKKRTPRAGNAKKKSS